MAHWWNSEWLTAVACGIGLIIGHILVKYQEKIEKKHK